MVFERFTRITYPRDTSRNPSNFTNIDWNSLLQNSPMPAQKSIPNQVVPQPGTKKPAGFLVPYPPEGGMRAVTGDGLRINLNYNLIQIGGHSADSQLLTSDPWDAGTDLTGLFGSLSLFVDTDCKMQITPGTTDTLYIPAGAWLSIPIRDVQDLHINPMDTTQNFRVALIFSASDTPVSGSVGSQAQVKYSGAVTLTKTAIAGTADSWTTVPLYSLDDSLSELQSGDATNYTICGGVQNQLFLVQNASTTNEVNVNLLVGTTDAGGGLTNDPSTGDSLTIPVQTSASTSFANILVTRPYNIFYARMRVDEAVADTQTAGVKVNYRGSFY